MFQEVKIKYAGKALISIVLFFIVILLCGLANEKVFSEQKSHLIQTNETPSRILTDERDTGDEFNSLTDRLYLTLPSSLLNQLSITIIESQSKYWGHVQDTVWLSVVNSMGHTGTIVPQTTLDDATFFPTTDILIVSHGVISIPSNRRNIIEQYIQQGGPVYIQGEYLCGYEPNQVFQSIVNSLGGSFSWGETVSGDLVPMNVLGALSNTPNSVPTLSYFWWGCEGSGDTTIENYLEYGGQYFGFIFTPPNPNYGPVITSSDQDWARAASENRLLMENIITYLAMTIETCDPICDQRTQGFWRRVCKKPHPEEPDGVDPYVTDVVTLGSPIFDGFVTDAICDLMAVSPPENDMCRKAKRQFMALLLNVASSRLTLCQSLTNGDIVQDAVDQIKTLLDGNPDPSSCELAKTIADDINNGITLFDCDSNHSNSVQNSSLFSKSSPNPFIKKTRIDYQVGDYVVNSDNSPALLTTGNPQSVTLRIYDLMGREIQTLFDGAQDTGKYSVEWDGKNFRGEDVPSSIYFYRLQVRDGQSNDFIVTKKLILIR
jgi:hypothetical protein